MRAAQKIRVDYCDADVKQRVARFLHGRYYPAFESIEVQVKHGEVTLTGEVGSFYEKQIALTSCQHVVGVLALVDNIEVRPAEQPLPARPR